MIAILLAIVLLTQSLAEARQYPKDKEQHKGDGKEVEFRRCRSRSRRSRGSCAGRKTRPSHAPPLVPSPPLPSPLVLPPPIPEIFNPPQLVPSPPLPDHTTQRPTFPWLTPPDVVTDSPPPPLVPIFYPPPLVPFLSPLVVSGGF
ncbi:hypothetical protein O6P43_017967 [Quillaja saponaria]|uniref:Uncharacterized protein n=1 Tax=Quillaja saponaria TaxID=32244 RepID=A0AAD7PPH9_QUISA|nr:hypothetical protein O6P43_017967 [Quillaja saponaria]